MTTRTEIAIINYKMNELISKKNWIEIRLKELYELREELIEDLKLQETPHNCCHEDRKELFKND